MYNITSHTSIRKGVCATYKTVTRHKKILGSSVRLQDLVVICYKISPNSVITQILNISTRRLIPTEIKQFFPIDIAWIKIIEYV